ncbi:SCO4225 family membrane protein [Streptomyces sp. NPDC085946]|uniref:SCO4225 family membrane protein n=1 Tax=Streptomyces sp. NPDC085946 TaxID=3365744 RepID=UPI0037D81C83
MANERNGGRHTAGQMVGRVAGRIADNWISRVCLMLYAAVWVWVAIDSTLVRHEDAAVWPWLITAPVSLPFLFLPEGGGAAGLARFVVPTLVAALVNAWPIGTVVRRLRRGHPAAA